LNSALELFINRKNSKIMEKHTIIVPKGIRYISDWDKLEEGKRLRDQVPQEGQYIMNKTITGCGYTEYWITNDYPTIICSPRLVLLENKEDQHQKDKNVLYLKNEFDSFESYDRDINRDDLSKEKEEEQENIDKAKEYTAYLNKKIDDHISYCYFTLHKSPKFLVTYDSFRRIREKLSETINNYQIVVDEFQSIFTDSRFKSDTENNFLYNLQGLKRVCYLSATPMIDKYLEMLPEFESLPYYELDWVDQDKTRVIKPFLKTKLVKSLLGEIYSIIKQYQDNKFEKLVQAKEDGTFEEVYSKEAVIYINSVKNICDIIKKCNLRLEDTNILCANDADNEKKIRDAFIKAGDTTITKDTKCIGKVPKEGESHKMFTLCTRTTYLGADFYSTNARSFIFSDANVDCLSVDITLDLPQILGRQRLECNPWKNRAELYYKLNTKEKTQEEFDKYLNDKIKMTEDLLNVYEKGDDSEKRSLALVYKERAKTKKYKSDFVAVDKHSGSNIKPVKNNLVMISEMRAFEIQQYDYKDRFSVFNALSKEVSDIEDVNYHLNNIYKLSDMTERYQYLCSLEESVALSCLPHLPESFVNYYTVLGPDRMRALRYNVTDMRFEYEGIIGNQRIDISEFIKKEFMIGEKVSKNSVKNRLKKVYESVGYSKTPRAIDLGDYFIIKNCMITNKETGKRDASYEIIAIKT
jgi:hypothetical protein